MKMLRRYAINPSRALGAYPLDIMKGNVSVGAENAGKNYVGLWMPGWKLLSCRYSCEKTTKRHGQHFLYIGELYHEERRLRGSLYVRELLERVLKQNLPLLISHIEVLHERA